MTTESRPQSGLTEQDLLKNFEAYQKILAEFESLYNVPASTELLREIPEPVYIAEPLFRYQVHTST
ncbi:MAG: hypothetical protein KGL31_09830 [candidate division NC10 bacterium]|nr:hypothetical protein [candidate division NC10 bacterium]MDE2322196.1 hypothetical protein [candidate division NC10 bacterium]